MAGDTTITVIGNLTADPELRFTPSGAAVANFTVASTPRSFDRQSNDWKDGDTLFMRCSVWRDAAEHAAESLHRGDRVVATGRLVSRSWETPEGEKRSVMEMQVDEVGPSLRYATAKVTKAERSSGGGQGGGWSSGGGGNSGGGNSGNSGSWGQGGQGRQGGAAAAGGQQSGAAETDPWATGGNTGGQGGQPASGGQPAQGGGTGGSWSGGPSYDEPPF